VAKWGQNRGILDQDAVIRLFRAGIRRLANFRDSKSRCGRNNGKMKHVAGRRLAYLEGIPL